jgi:hypothetical protein
MRITAVFLCLAMLLLAGCGIKPPKVDPPPGTEKDYFPRTYPDPSTDPRPNPEKLIR